MTEQAERPRLMTCGCVPMSRHRNEHDGLGANHWSCVTHDCCTAATTLPDLAGRAARCDYYGKPAHKTECPHCRTTCQCERPSSFDLPFFVFEGDGTGSDLCANCGCRDYTHQPRWRVILHVDRNWFNAGRVTQKIEETFYAPEGSEVLAAKTVADRFHQQHQHDKSKVHGVTLGLIRPGDMNQCQAFTPRGPLPFDRFYCGCYGWD